ncbi:diguanylate cyclase [Billgrantia azerbaijanica]|nr:diguanylate cyclase [Halomonas azerbaijanica]
MAERTGPECGDDRAALCAEIARLNKVIQALMDRAERTSSVQDSAFGLFETAVVLEDQVRRRTRQLEAALRENEKITRALEQAKARMEEEIRQRVQTQDALEVANRQLEALSVTEPLTGLANRRGFDTVLAAEWQRAMRRETSIGVAMADIDTFKRYNDRYGHLAGDDCLRKVAAALRQSVRQRDLVARYGGEEIVLILPGADEATTRQAAERARAAVAALEIRHVDSVAGVVTVSVGVASMIPATGLGPDRLLALADAALYRAKAEGRNRVCVAEASAG